MSSVNLASPYYWHFHFLCMSCYWQIASRMNKQRRSAEREEVRIYCRLQPNIPCENYVQFTLYFPLVASKAAAWRFWSTKSLALRMSCIMQQGHLTETNEHKYINMAVTLMMIVMTTTKTMMMMMMMILITICSRLTIIPAAFREIPVCTSNSLYFVLFSLSTIQLFFSSQDVWFYTDNVL